MYAHLIPIKFSKQPAHLSPVGCPWNSAYSSHVAQPPFPPKYSSQFIHLDTAGGGGDFGRETWTNQAIGLDWEIL